MKDLPEHSCFIAGIIKGLMEHDDPIQHFGSTISFLHFARDAETLGYVENKPDRELILTPKGRQYYEAMSLRELPDSRAYMWPDKNWNPEA